MKIGIQNNLKYGIQTTSNFNKDLKRVSKQGKNLDKLYFVINKLANGEKLDEKYKNHILINDKNYKDCEECHIEPDWLLIYKYYNDKLILLLVNTGSHGNLFNK